MGYDTNIWVKNWLCEDKNSKLTLRRTLGLISFKYLVFFLIKIICEIRKLSRYNGKLRMKDLIDYGFYHLSDKKKVLKFGVD